MAEGRCTRGLHLRGGGAGATGLKDVLFGKMSAETTAVLTGKSACSVMVIIGASQALDPGSIPGRRTSPFWGISSIGRVRALQARGTGIETPMLHLCTIFLCGRGLLFGVDQNKNGSMGELNPRPLAP